MKNLYKISIIILLLVFIVKGRSIYMPIINKIKNKETISSVNGKLNFSVYDRLKEDLTRIGLKEYPSKIAICAFKEERVLEVYVQQHNSMQKLKSYKFTNFSGHLGPKLQEGDKQIPEGIYSIEYLNPNSSFYLSMKINYPNAFDKAKGKLDGRINLGSDIFIHGKSSTIGCIPVGDEAIEEIFTLSSHALSKGIEVIISPKDFRLDPSEPNIESVEWSGELYSAIKTKLLNQF